MPRFIPPTLGLLLLLATSHLTAQWRNNCVPSSDPSSQFQLKELKGTLSNPTLQSWRNNSKLPTVDTATVVAISADSLCQHAAKLIYRVDGPPPGKLFLFKVGSVYWARDPSQTAGEFTLSFTLDSTLTQVLVRVAG